MNLISNLKIKFLILLLLALAPERALADPEVNGELIPPGEASYVVDPTILKKLNLGPDDEPVWCYSNLANSLIITSAEREREKCKLKLQQELQRSKINCDFLVDQLNISMESLTEKHEKILSLKNDQIDKLTAATMDVPNDYSFWWATGGFITGAVITTIITMVVSR